ncbi:DNA damage-inducible transcript 3 protein isoform X1 [Acomys russatus]|uniref:DNA damage-inducible transcript 3 protein isoform X1 n=2 Tax=Acomys russatus TaxID=60746 RepID=UPI0021E1CC4F|nr:DNA damage-inducible transcript 3 protein isoform X1 [Acomys russatus]
MKRQHKRSSLGALEVSSLSLTRRLYHVEDERVAATEPKQKPEPEERELGPTTDMAAESLPFTFETVSSWELEAWYEDLQEVLSADEIGGSYISSPGNEEEESKTFTTLDPASLAWLTEEPGPAEVTSTSQSPCSPESSQSSMAQEEEEEDQGRTRKRKQSGQCPARAGKQRMKEKEQENERKVAQLAQENERLKREIERLTREVETTRRALIDRMVSLHQS